MHMKNNLFIVLLLLSTYVFSQEKKLTKSLIITVSVKGGVHKTTNTFYWFVNCDSIDVVKSKYKILPLYLPYDFSNDIFTRCNNGQQINLFEMTTQTDMNFKKEYLKKIDTLKQIIRDNKTLVQKIIKKRKNSPKYKVTISVTPILGIFQYCKPTKKMREKFDIGNQIVLPISGFKLKPKYLELYDIKEFLLFYDFSRYSISNRLF